jgi:hypothetical protein
VLNFYVIPTHKDYEISLDGIVRNKKTNRILKHSMSDTGYYTVYVDKANKLLHRLIAETFIPNPDNLPCVNHKDGNKLNNNIDNLEWCTQKENNIHAKKMGLNPYTVLYGEESRHHKLTQNDVAYIRKVYKKYDPVFGGRALAKQFNVTESCISAIVRGISWGW